MIIVIDISDLVQKIVPKMDKVSEKIIEKIIQKDDGTRFKDIIDYVNSSLGTSRGTIISRIQQLEKETIIEKKQIRKKGHELYFIANQAISSDPLQYGYDFDKVEHELLTSFEKMNQEDFSGYCYKLILQTLHLHKLYSFYKNYSRTNFSDKILDITLKRQESLIKKILNFARKQEENSYGRLFCAVANAIGNEWELTVEKATRKSMKY